MTPFQRSLAKVRPKGAPMKSLQQTYAPHNSCFGCGPANEKGLKVGTIARNENETYADWKAESYHEAFPGVLNGGIIGSLLDCHSNWTAAWHLMHKTKQQTPPCTVTAEYSIKLLRPTPTNSTIHLEAVVVDSKDDRAKIEAKLMVDGKVCATCTGLFVAVKPGHPAYHRW